MIELLFALSALFVLPFWLLMIGLPGWRFTRLVMDSPLVFVPLPILYLVLLVVYSHTLIYLVENPTLPGLMAVLTHADGVLIAWVHVLAVDLIAGRWIYLDSQERGYHPLVVAPALWLTLLVGPVGFFIYALERTLLAPAEAPAGQE